MAGWSAGGSNAMAPAGGGAVRGGYDPIKRAERTRMNWEVSTKYAAFLAAVMGAFILLHWSRYLAIRLQRSDSGRSFFPNFLTRTFTVTSRIIRNIAVRKMPLFLSVGHGFLVLLYIAINTFMNSLNVDVTTKSNIAARAGWLLSCNLAFAVFLALKNTPLAFLTAYSHERLNNLHQVVGCTAFVMLAVHASVYTSYFADMGRLEKLREHEQIGGIVAAFSMFATVISAMFLRRYWYEAFYVTHILFFIAIVIGIGIHRPDFATKTAIIMCIVGAMWLVDRAIRLSRLLVNSVNQEATIYPLPDGGTRILLAKKPARVEPGKHLFVWIPAIRTFETHPFTIISTSPVEFVVKTYDGFTRDLHNYATRNPGARLRASVDGPYGTFPDPMLFDKVVLIAGGSGASFAFGLATNLLERMGSESTKSIELIWTVKTHNNLLWFADKLRELHEHPNSPNCKVSLYVSRIPSSSASSSDIDVSSRAQRPTLNDDAPASPNLEKVLGVSTNEKSKDSVHEFHSAAQGDTDAENISNAMLRGPVPTGEEKEAMAGAAPADLELCSHVSSTAPLRQTVTQGRPRTEELIRRAIADTPAPQRVLVLACGPDSLMCAARNATASCIKPNGPGVELHCEQFGW